MVIPILANAQMRKGPGYRSGIYIGYAAFLPEKMEIMPLHAPRPDVEFRSMPKISYQGRLEFAHSIGSRWDVSVGIMAGVYPYNHTLSVDSSFSGLGSNYQSGSIGLRGVEYGGWTLKFGFVQPVLEKHFFSFHLGGNYVIFIPQSQGSGGSSSGTRIYTMRVNVNPARKAFLAPEAAFRYTYRLGRYLMPAFTLFGVYSNNRPIVRSTYRIFGKHEDLGGTFSRRFVHIGAELGVMFRL